MEAMEAERAKVVEELKETKEALESAERAFSESPPLRALSPVAEGREKAMSLSTTNLRQPSLKASRQMRSVSARNVLPQSEEILVLREELKEAKSATIELKGQLQQMTIGQGIETAFVKEEQFANEKIAIFRQQTLDNLHGAIADELAEKYEDLDDGDESDSDSAESKGDGDGDGDGDAETKTKFDLLIDRAASEFLFVVLMESMEAMKARKSKICRVIAKQLHVEDNERQSAEQMIATMIHPQLQQRWEHYLRSEMENNFEIEVTTIEPVVDAIFDAAVSLEQFEQWGFLRNQYRRQIKTYIMKCCEICWIMILTKPTLSFYPSSFRELYGPAIDGNPYDETSEKHDLWTGSKTEGAKIAYFAVPAILQQHLLNKEKALSVVPGQLFAHNDQELIDYIMSDPEEMLKNH